MNEPTEDQLKLPSNRSFGFVMATFFLIVAFLPLVHGKPVRGWVLILSVSLVFVAVYWPRVLAPFNRIWMRVGLLMHKIVSPIVLAAIFFLIVTPTGLLVRLVGKELLKKKLEPAAESYWVERQSNSTEANSMHNQF